MKFLIIMSFIFLSANAQELNQKNTYKLIQTIDEIEIRVYWAMVPQRCLETQYRQVCTFPYTAAT